MSAVITELSTPVIYQAAAYYAAQGLRVTPIPPRSKGPVLKGWNLLNITPADVPRFFGPHDNIGVICGGDLVCVDLDHPAAVAYAPMCLPPTAACIGRPSNPRSHWVYRIKSNHEAIEAADKVYGFRSPHPRAGEINEVTGKVTPETYTVHLVDLIYTGKQFVVGPSHHDEDPEQYDPLVVANIAEVDGLELLDALKRLHITIMQDAASRGVVILQDTGNRPRKDIPPSPGGRPGDNYNRSDDWRDLLTSYGWTRIGGSPANEHWKRPGKKEHGVSATFNGKCFYVFSSNAAPLQANRGYDPVGLLAAYQFGGNFEDAIKWLYTQPQYHDPHHGVDISGFDAAVRSEIEQEHAAVRLRKHADPDEGGDTSFDVTTFQSAQPADSTGSTTPPLPPGLDPFPEEALRVPGFIGDLTKYILDTQIGPQPLLAFGAAIAAWGAALGWGVYSSIAARTHTNLYVLGLCPSGGGKEHARRIIKSLFEQSRASTRIGADQIGSAQGILTSLKATTTVLFPIDEVGDLLCTMKGKNAPSHVQNISMILKIAKTSAGTVFRPPALKDLKSTEPIPAPHCCVYATTVPNGFWQNVSHTEIDGGLLGRFLVFQVDGYASTRDRHEILRAPIPPHLIEAVNGWWDLAEGAPCTASETDFKVDHNAETSRPNRTWSYEIGHTQEAAERFFEHAQNISDRQIKEFASHQQLRAAIWARTAENTAQLATLFAASRVLEPSETNRPVITLDDVNLGIKVSNYCARWTCHHVASLVSDTDHGRLARQVFSKIPLGPVDWISRSDLLKALHNNISKRSLDEVISTLCEARAIIFKTIQTPNKPGPVPVCFQKLRPSLD